MTAPREHWLRRVARQSGLRVDGVESATAALPLADVWSAVAAAAEISEANLARHVAAAFGLQVADDEPATVNDAALKLVSSAVARQFGVVPMALRDNLLTVATSDPTNIAAEQALGFASGRRIIFAVAPPARLREWLSAAYASERLAGLMVTGLQAKLADAVHIIDRAAPPRIAVSDAETPPVIRLTNLILHDAVQAGASDIHIEPELKDGVVRTRVDGVLRTYMALPRPVHDRVVSRLKVMANMDVADRLRPHAGHAQIEVGGVDYDLRLSTVPTRQSEKAVVRILGPGRARSLDDIDIPESEMRRLRRLFGHRDGLVVVTGPTGSGKTTTLYSALQDLASAQINVMTVEDPVEYEIAGMTQIQVAARQGLTFASVLRTILRQDPDVILLGEVRDLETAEVAFQAGLTGHLVLTTLHTADAIGVLGRLSGLGINRANIAAAVRGVVAQRLVRRLCRACRVAAEPPTPEEDRLSQVYGVRAPYRAIGCERCSGSGYRGRLPVVEVFVNTPEIEHLIAAGEGSSRIRRIAEQSGMIPLLAAGLARVRDGETTLTEVERVLGLGTEAPVAAPAPGAHVIVVGRDAAVRQKLHSTLENIGFRVSGAADPASAWQRLNAGEPFDVVLIAFDLAPDERDLLRKLRSSPATAGLPVIAVLSVNRHLERELLEDGVEDIIYLPLDAVAVRARVRACLGRRAGAAPRLTPGAPVAPSDPAVAVLPFADLSPAQDQAYLCDGLAEELTHALSRLEGIQVAPQTSAFRFRSVQGDLRDVGRQLGVTAILQGSVQKLGSRARIAVRLVNVQDGSDLFSEQYDRDVTDVAALEDEIAQKVRDRLRVVVFSMAPQRAPPSRPLSAEAHELYLRGRYEWNRRSEQSLERGIDYFRQAVACAPDYAAAYAALADVYVTLGIYGTRPPGDVMPLAIEAASRATAIDPNSAAALTARSCVQTLYLWDWNCEDGFLSAAELEPGNPTVHHWYASNYLMPLGRFPAARLALGRALALDPQSMPVRASAGLMLYLERRYEEAAAHQRALMSADPGFWLARYFFALASTELGRYDEAIDALQSAKQTTDSPEIDSALGHALGRAGRRDAARGVAADLVKLSAERYVSPALVAQVAAGLGDADLAMRHLEEAFTVRATELVWLGVRPAFDSLRADPRFADLCARILPAARPGSSGAS